MVTYSAFPTSLTMVSSLASLLKSFTLIVFNAISTIFSLQLIGTTVQLTSWSRDLMFLHPFASLMFVNI